MSASHSGRSQQGRRRANSDRSEASANSREQQDTIHSFASDPPSSNPSFSRIPTARGRRGRNSSTTNSGPSRGSGSPPEQASPEATSSLASLGYSDFVQIVRTHDITKLDIMSLPLDQLFCHGFPLLPLQAKIQGSEPVVHCAAPPLDDCNHAGYIRELQRSVWETSVRYLPNAKRVTPTALRCALIDAMVNEVSGGAIPSRQLPKRRRAAQQPKGIEVDLNEELLRTITSAAKKPSLSLVYQSIQQLIIGGGEAALKTAIMDMAGKIVESAPSPLVATGGPQSAAQSLAGVLFNILVCIAAISKRGLLVEVMTHLLRLGASNVSHTPTPFLMKIIAPVLHLLSIVELSGPQWEDIVGPLKQLLELLPQPDTTQPMSSATFSEKFIIDSAASLKRKSGPWEAAIPLPYASHITVRTPSTNVMASVVHTNTDGKVTVYSFQQLRPNFLLDFTAGTLVITCNATRSVKFFVEAVGVAEVNAGWKRELQSAALNALIKASSVLLAVRPQMSAPTTLLRGGINRDSLNDFHLQRLQAHTVSNPDAPVTLAALNTEGTFAIACRSDQKELARAVGSLLLHFRPAEMVELRSAKEVKSFLQRHVHLLIPPTTGGNGSMQQQQHKDPTTTPQTPTSPLKPAGSGHFSPSFAPSYLESARWLVQHVAPAPKTLSDSGVTTPEKLLRQVLELLGTPIPDIAEALRLRSIAALFNLGGLEILNVVLKVRHVDMTLYGSLIDSLRVFFADTHYVSAVHGAGACLEGTLRTQAHALLNHLFGMVRNILSLGSSEQSHHYIRRPVFCGALVCAIYGLVTLEYDDEDHELLQRIGMSQLLPQLPEGCSEFSRTPSFEVLDEVDETAVIGAWRGILELENVEEALTGVQFGPHPGVNVKDGEHYAVYESKKAVVRLVGEPGSCGGSSGSSGGSNQRQKTAKGSCGRTMVEDTGSVRYFEVVFRTLKPSMLAGFVPVEYLNNDDGSDDADKPTAAMVVVDGTGTVHLMGEEIALPALRRGDVFGFGVRRSADSGSTTTQRIFVTRNGRLVVEKHVDQSTFIPCIRWENCGGSSDTSISVVHPHSFKYDPRQQHPSVHAEPTMHIISHVALNAFQFLVLRALVDSSKAVKAVGSSSPTVPSGEGASWQRSASNRARFIEAACALIQQNAQHFAQVYCTAYDVQLLDDCGSTERVKTSAVMQVCAEAIRHHLVTAAAVVEGGVVIPNTIVETLVELIEATSLPRSIRSGALALLPKVTNALTKFHVEAAVAVDTATAGSSGGNENDILRRLVDFLFNSVEPLDELQDRLSAPYNPVWSTDGKKGPDVVVKPARTAKFSKGQQAVVGTPLPNTSGLVTFTVTPHRAMRSEGNLIGGNFFIGLASAEFVDALPAGTEDEQSNEGRACANLNATLDKWTKKGGVWAIPDSTKSSPLSHMVPLAGSSGENHVRFGCREPVRMAFDREAGTLSYYKNEVFIGTAFTNIPSDATLYPFVFSPFENCTAEIAADEPRIIDRAVLRHGQDSIRATDILRHLLASPAACDVVLSTMLRALQGGESTRVSAALEVLGCHGDPFAVTYKDRPAEIDSVAGDNVVLNVPRTCDEEESSDASLTEKINVSMQALRLRHHVPEWFTGFLTKTASEHPLFASCMQSLLGILGNAINESAAKGDENCSAVVVQRPATMLAILRVLLIVADGNPTLLQPETPTLMTLLLRILAMTNESKEGPSTAAATSIADVLARHYNTKLLRTPFRRNMEATAVTPAEDSMRCPACHDAWWTETCTATGMPHRMPTLSTTVLHQLVAAKQDDTQRLKTIAAESGTHLEICGPWIFDERPVEIIAGEEPGSITGKGCDQSGEFTMTGKYVPSTRVVSMTFEYKFLEAPPESPASAGGGEWACEVCTFLNNNDARRCAMCNTARPGAVWACSQCTYAFNEVGAPRCEMCGSAAEGGRSPSVAEKAHTVVCPTCMTKKQIDSYESFEAIAECSKCGTSQMWCYTEPVKGQFEGRVCAAGDILLGRFLKTSCKGMSVKFRREKSYEQLATEVREMGVDPSGYIDALPDQPAPPVRQPGQPITVNSASDLARLLAAVVHEGHGGPPPSVLAQVARSDSQQASRDDSDSNTTSEESVAAKSARLEDRALTVLCDHAQQLALVLLPFANLDPAACFAVLKRSVATRSFNTIVSSLEPHPLRLLAVGVLRSTEPTTAGKGKGAQSFETAIKILSVVSLEDCREWVYYEMYNVVCRAAQASPRKLLPDIAAVLCRLLRSFTYDNHLEVLNLVIDRLMATPVGFALAVSARMKGFRGDVPAAVDAMALYLAAARRIIDGRPALKSFDEPVPETTGVAKDACTLEPLADTSIGEDGLLAMGQVKGSVGLEPTDKGKYYYEIIVPAAHREVRIGWGTMRHAIEHHGRHVGTDIQSFAYDLRESVSMEGLRRDYAPPKAVEPGDVVGTLLNLDDEEVEWSVNGTRMGPMAFPQLGEALFPFISANVDAQYGGVRIVLEKPRYLPAGYSDLCGTSTNVVPYYVATAESSTVAPQSYSMYRAVCALINELEVDGLSLDSFMHGADKERQAWLEAANRRLPAIPALHRLVTEEGHDIPSFVPYIRHLVHLSSLASLAVGQASLLKECGDLMATHKEAKAILLYRARKVAIDSSLRMALRTGRTTDVVIARDAFAEHAGQTVDFASTVFGQVMEQLGNHPSHVFRQTPLFRVQLQGEMSEDRGGLYRGCWSLIADEIMTGKLSLFVPNTEHSSYKNVIPNSPSAGNTSFSGLHLQAFEFLGRLMGNAVLTSSAVLPVYFPRLVWKFLLCDEIKAEDYYFDVCDSMRNAINDKAYLLDDELFFDNLPDVVEYIDDIRRDPASSTLQEEEIRSRAAKQCLIHRFDTPLLAMRAGFTSVVPDAAIADMTHFDLQRRVCGASSLTAKELLDAVDISSIPAEVAIQFSEAVGEMSPDQRSQLLLFISGQCRLPLQQVVQVHCGTEPDQRPTAHTCSPITLTLQPYKSREEMMERLLESMAHAHEFGFV